MSLALVQSRALLGLQAPAVTVEVHLANGLPSFTLVGLADVEVKEARERVRSALQNAGLEFPHNKRITVLHRVFFTIHNNFSFTRFNSQELIYDFMNLHTDIFIRHK